MAKKRPDWRVSVPTKIREREGEEKTFWTPVGVGFNNPDSGRGVSISLRLNLSSPGGEYVLFPFDQGKPSEESVS